MSTCFVFGGLTHICNILLKIWCHASKFGEFQLDLAVAFLLQVFLSVDDRFLEDYTEQTRSCTVEFEVVWRSSFLCQPRCVPLLVPYVLMSPIFNYSIGADGLIIGVVLAWAWKRTWQKLIELHRARTPSKQVGYSSSQFSIWWRPLSLIVVVSIVLSQSK